MIVTDIFKTLLPGKEYETLETLLKSQGYDIDDAEMIAKEFPGKIDDCEFKIFEYSSYEFSGSWFWDSENGLSSAIVCKNLEEYLGSC